MALQCRFVVGMRRMRRILRRIVRTYDVSNIILVIFGVLIAAAAALMTLYFGGDAFTKYSEEAEAGRLVSEGAQIEAAVELYYRHNGKFPDEGDPMNELMDKDYLSSMPLGTEYTTGDWVVDYDEGQIRSTVGSASDDDAISICQTARRQLKMPEPEKVYKCDGSDYPGGRLSSREPCCIRG